ncbi:MAG: tRNA (adenosine(37)-N6)-threonylcarbamoyltransferase complex dimerization subunit type 1 TsaB [Bryobacterales bacterium]|nr:tRNA (adenosine(37)-N6)-threonylcarbamoyltransferase complex dimerization subunit type 1 TsaB [Bryobacterales bacterium]
MTANILILDTASGAGAVAFSMDGNLRSRRSLSAPRRQAEEIFPAIDAILVESGLRLKELQAVAVSTGPGAFTSLRVGLTAAKSLAEVGGLPLIGISSMAAVALLAPGFPAAMLLPASRGEFFLSVATLPPPAEGEPPLAEPLLTEVELVRPESWLTSRPAPPRYVLSPSPEILDLAADQLPAESRCLLIPGNWLPQLAALAQDRYLRAAFDDPLRLDAAYARKADADKSWQDPRLVSS